MKTLLRRGLLCASTVLLFTIPITAAARPAALVCGASTAPLGQTLMWAVQRMTVDGDTETQHILKFVSISPAVWVTDETKCTKILATVDKLWPAPRGGPVYVMQLGTDYAVIQGDKKAGPNRPVMHVDAAFKYIASIVWQ
jgi:hypothetical protein